MRRLPLHGRRPVVAGRMRVAVVVVTVVAVVVMMAVMIVVHGQKLTGLSMMDLCLPSVPWATIEPSASTTTRTPNSAVMSEVS